MKLKWTFVGYYMLFFMNFLPIDPDLLIIEQEREYVWEFFV